MSVWIEGISCTGCWG